MFDKKCFKENQRILLRLLNNPITKRWFRYVLRISCKEVINQITPNSYTFGGKLILDNGKLKTQFKTDFRTHNKYSKRLYYGFLPIWKLFHVWDILVANKLNVSWNLGFDHTFNPQEGTGGTNTTCDGFVYYFSGSDMSWSDIRGQASGTADDTSDPVSWILIKTRATPNKFDRLQRGILTFDTSIIGSADINSATFSIKGTGKSDGMVKTPNINIYAVTPAANNALASADYNITNFGSTAYCDTNIAYTDWNTSAYNDFVLNATGLAAISKTGITKIGTRNQNYDVANTDPSIASEQTSSLTGNSADAAGTASDPKLLVVYSLTITPSNATITLSGQTPVVVATITVNPSNGAITISGQVPTITKTGGFDYPDKNISTWTFITKN